MNIYLEKINNSLSKINNSLSEINNSFSKIKKVRKLSNSDSFKNRILSPELLSQRLHVLDSLKNDDSSFNSRVYKFLVC